MNTQIMLVKTGKEGATNTPLDPDQNEHGRFDVADGSITIMRRHRYRIYPNSQQTKAFENMAGVCRLIWNLALEQRITWGQRHKIYLNKQSKDLTKLRGEFDWIKDCPRVSQAMTLASLDTAFKRFFQHKSGFPKFKKRGAGDGFGFAGRNTKIERLGLRMGRVKIPKIGWVKIRLHNDAAGDLRNAVVKRTALGWDVSVLYKHTIEIADNNGPSVGIDRGVAIPLMLSDGTSYSLPEQLKAIDKKTRKAQRVASKKKRGGKRHKKAVRRVARLRAKTARVRNHWQHEITTEIADKYGSVALEDLKTANMTRSAKGTAEKPGKNVRAKAGLSRAILNVGWHGIQEKLAYKLAERGGELHLVPAAYSSQTCAECGVVDKLSRESQSVFDCVHCGAKSNADHNAAKVILQRANCPCVEIAA